MSSDSEVVKNAISPSLGAVHVYQTECPSAVPAWTGSPGSAVAFTLLAPNEVWSTGAGSGVAKPSLGGADICAAATSVVKAISS